MAKRGPKPIVIEWDQFEKLCGIQCTLHEIASYFDCSEDTLEKLVKKKYQKKFSEVFRAKRHRGHISLRRKQYELALSGHPSMLIWLGKQYLAQADKQEQLTDLKKTIILKYSDDDDEQHSELKPV